MSAVPDTMDKSAPLVSIVVPFYNEAAILRANLAAILSAAATPGHAFELLAVDDGSQDASAAEAAAAAQADARIRVISLTRNFGKEAAILAGLANARGAAVVVLDADLQHPPALIPKMIESWRAGFCVVDGVKASRGTESLKGGLFARGFYGLFRRLAGMDIRDHADFKLLDRAVVDAYLAFPEKQRFFRGLVHWAGYPSARLPFEVQERNGGAPSWGTLRLMRYAIDNITSFSSAPLKLVGWVGALTLAVGVVFGAISLVQKLQGKALDGFTTVNLLIVIIGGGILVSLGIIGHYLARLYDEVKARPTYLIKPDRSRTDE